MVTVIKCGRSYAIRINPAAVALAGFKKGDLVTLEHQNGQCRVRKVLEGQKDALGSLIQVNKTEALLFTTGGAILRREGFGLGAATIVRIFEGSIVFDPEPLRPKPKDDEEPTKGRPRAGKSA